MNNKPLILSIWPFLTGRRKFQLLFLILLMFFGAIAEMASLGAIIPFIAALSETDINSSFFTRFGIQNLALDEDKSIVIIVCIVFISLILLSISVRLALAYFSNKIAYGIGADLGVRVFNSIIRRPYRWHIENNSSASIGGITKVYLVVSGYIQPILNIITSSVIFICLTSLLFYIEPVATGFGLMLCGILYALIAVVVKNLLRRNGSTIAQVNDQRIKELQEALGGIRDLILDSCQEIYTAKFHSLDHRMRMAQASNDFLMTSPRILIEAIFFIGLSIFVFYGARGGGIQEILPSLAALGMGVQRLMPLTQSIYAGWNSIVANERSVRDVFELLDFNPPEVTPYDIRFSNEMLLENASFWYTDDSSKVALNNVSIRIAKGNIVGIIGATGSGKSTLVDVLMGLIPLRSGIFKVDQIELNDESKLKSWGSLISHVPQSIYLADCSIAENIAFGVPIDAIDWGKLRLAAKSAEALEFIELLPDGFMSLIGEKGARLSGGQRQRIGLARALYRNSKVLILDEATSALDSFTESKVIENIVGNFKDLTIIMVAHRFSTLRHTDFVVKIEDGLVAGVLRYADLEV